jgi:hypothetical protein
VHTVHLTLEKGEKEINSHYQNFYKGTYPIYEIRKFFYQFPAIDSASFFNL